MKKNELIKQLLDIPGNPEVAIVDWRKNINRDSGDGAVEGVYTEYEIDFISKQDLSILAFDNEEYDNFGKHLDNH